MSGSIRFRILAIASVTSVSLVGGLGTAAASPPSVDNVVNTIATNASGGKWGTAEKNIESLEKTIRIELSSRHTPVAVASDPIAPLVTANAARIAALKADYGVMLDALTTLQKAQKKATTQVIAAVAEAIETRVPNIVGGLEAIQAIPTIQDAKEIGAKLRTMRSLDKAVHYVSGLMNSLRPAIHEANSDRNHLSALERKFTKVMSTFGITPGGAPVAPKGGTPQASQHPKVSGVWTQPQYCDATGGRITITQAANGDVTAINMSWPACPATIVGKNFRWESANTLVYDVVNTGPGWAPTGGHRVTFSADGRSNSVDWWDSLGRSGTTSWTRVS